MTSAFRWFRRLGLACLFSSAAATMAQPERFQPGNADALDPPGRVARVADVSGSVWVQDPDSGEWSSALRNQPLTRGDRLATDAGGRAELRVGSTTLRLDGDSELEVLRLDDERIELQLHQGSLAARLRNPDALREFELRTAEGRFVAQRTGGYRLDRHDDGSALTVYGGQALYEGPGAALTVYSRQRADFRLDRRGVAQYALAEPLADEFAAWTADLDRADDRAQGRPGEPIGERLAAGRYVSPEMTGAEELDRNGSWDNDPEYGALWIPRTVPAGWAPYAAGRWAWVRPWGWTWIDDAPWGFAPFHYGRWVQRRNVWCWAPGSYVARPVYAPALVGWIGAPVRSGVSISISIGHPGPAVGWFPLAPREVFVPGYRVTPRYVREVNVSHVRNISNLTAIVNNPQGAISGYDYRNRRDPRAVTMVPEAVLRHREPVAGPAATWRREVGERGGRDLGPTTALLAPPAVDLRRLPGRPNEAGRPEGPRDRVPREARPWPGPAARGTDAPVALPARPLPAPAAALPAMPAPLPPARVEVDPTRRDDRRFNEPRRDERQDERRDDRRDGRPPAAAPIVPPRLAAPVAVPATPAPVRGTMTPPPVAPAALPAPAPAAVPPVPAAPRGNPMSRPLPEVPVVRTPAEAVRPGIAPSPEVRRELPRERAPERAADKPADRPVEKPVDRPADRAAEARPGFEERRERGDRAERRQAN